MSSAFRMYSSLFKVALKNEMTYKWGVFLSSFMMMLSSLIGIAVWLAVYTFSNVSAIRGVPLSSTIIYFVVLGALSPMLSWSGIVDFMNSAIKGGSITSALIRPMGYFSQLMISDMAMNLPNIAMVSVPLLVIIALLAHLSLTLPLALLTVAYIALGYMMMSFLGFAIGSLAFKLRNVYGIAMSINWGVTIIGGGMLPLVFFPSAVQHILLMLPFPFMAFVPSATLTGILSYRAAASLLPEAIAWTVILGVVAYAVWKRMITKLEVVGI